MEYRKLGRTGLDVSAVGLGTEYLNRRPQKTVAAVVAEAVERGINYLDIVFAFPEYRDNLGAALQGRRDKVLLAGHICTAETNGHYRLSRDVPENERLFHDLLSRLHTDYVDVVFVQMVNSEEGYDEVTRPGGVLDLAQRLKREGKARFIGMSGHRRPAALQAIRSGATDVWMFPINLAWDFAPGRKEVFQTCAECGVGLVAMKPFAGGRLFQQKERPVTVVQCLHYALSQPGVCTAVPGVKNMAQLQSVLRYAAASETEKDYRPLLAALQQEAQGNCVYCNHCMPCPEGIDIGATIRRVDLALLDATAGPQGRKRLADRVNVYYPGRIRAAVQKVRSASASACVECGVCMQRCPFDVDVISKMQWATQRGW